MCACVTIILLLWMRTGWPVKIPTWYLVLEYGEFWGNSQKQVYNRPFCGQKQVRRVIWPVGGLVRCIFEVFSIMYLFLTEKVTVCTCFWPLPFIVLYHQTSAKEASRRIFVSAFRPNSQLLVVFFFNMFPYCWFHQKGRGVIGVAGSYPHLARYDMIRYALCT